MRWTKVILCSLLVMLLLPAMNAHAFTGLYSPYKNANTVVLAWQPQSGETSFSIYKNYSQLVGTTSSSSYMVTGLNACTTYSFNVTSNLGYSASISVKTLCTDSQAPTAPTNLTYTAYTMSVRASWTASTDNVEVQDYLIYKNGSYVGSTTNTYYSVPNLSPNTGYTIGVRARDAQGNLSAMTSRVMYTNPVQQVFTINDVSGDIALEGYYSNYDDPHDTNITITLRLYRVTGSGETLVGTKYVYLPNDHGEYKTVTLAWNQPYGDYKCVVTPSVYDYINWGVSGMLTAN